MAKVLKQMMADAVRADLEASPNVFVMGMLPMDAEATVALRTDLRGLGARMRVVHNRTATLMEDILLPELLQLENRAAPILRP